MMDPNSEMEEDGEYSEENESDDSHGRMRFNNHYDDYHAH